MGAPEARNGESGLTLVEVLVSLALFSLIGVAGFSITDSILRAQRAVDGRLDRLGQIQRAMHLMTLDFEQIAGTDLTFDGNRVSFRRFTDTDPVLLAYHGDGKALLREVGNGFGAGASVQTGLAGVSDVRWRFYRTGVGWLDIWPPNADDLALPQAVAAEMVLTGRGPAGAVRRVVRLPRAIAP